MHILAISLSPRSPNEPPRISMHLTVTLLYSPLITQLLACRLEHRVAPDSNGSSVLFRSSVLFQNRFHDRRCSPSPLTLPHCTLTLPPLYPHPHPISIAPTPAVTLSPLHPHRRSPYHCTLTGRHPIPIAPSPAVTLPHMLAHLPRAHPHPCLRVPLSPSHLTPIPHPAVTPIPSCHLALFLPFLLSHFFFIITYSFSNLLIMTI